MNLLDKLFGKKVEVKIPYNVGKATIVITAKNGVSYTHEITGRWGTLYGGGGCPPRSYPKHVDHIFENFIEESRKGLVQVAENLWIPYTEVSTIELVNKEDFDIYRTRYKRIRGK